MPLEGANVVYQAPACREAITRLWDWASKWRSSQPKAVACLETDLDELLNFLSCPKSHWRKIRTTNAIERAFPEVRCRTRPMSCFQTSTVLSMALSITLTHPGGRRSPFHNLHTFLDTTLRCFFSSAPLSAHFSANLAHRLSWSFLAFLCL